MAMPRGLRKVAREASSDRFPGFFARSDGKYSKLYLYRGRQVRQYYVLVNCSVCRNETLVCRQNAPRQKHFSCSDACRNELRFVPDGARKYKRGSYGGHVLIKAQNHPAARKGFIPEHRLIIEKHIGRYVTAKERVHHINVIEDDNRVENLVLCRDHREHALIHGSLNQCVAALLERGHLLFDSATKRYRVP